MSLKKRLKKMVCNGAYKCLGGELYVQAPATQKIRRQLRTYSR